MQKNGCFRTLCESKTRLRKFKRLPAILKLIRGAYNDYVINIEDREGERFFLLTNKNIKLELLCMMYLTWD